jgi:hypothetical protein
VDKEIEELRKRIDRLEWLIGVMREKETVDALKGSLIDAQRRLEELLKRRNGGIVSDALYFHVQAIRLTRLAGRSGNLATAAALRDAAADLADHAEALRPGSARRTG